MPEITVFPLRTMAYSCRAFTANSLKAAKPWRAFHSIGDELQMNRGLSIRHPVFTDVDLLLLDQTSYFGRCVCSGLFYGRVFNRLRYFRKVTT